MTQYRYIQRHFDELILECFKWVDSPNEERIIKAVNNWDESTWNNYRLVLMVQGLGPYIYYKISNFDSYSSIPQEFASWISNQYQYNKLRIERVHSNLQSILREAKLAGIEAMPLKGSILTTGYYPQPENRPMADIDILIHPKNMLEMDNILVKLGYRNKMRFSQFTHHEIYIKQDDEQVIYWEGEHPDNPIPVEIHAQLKKNIWGSDGAVDMTDMMWEDCIASDILGEPAFFPSNINLFTHLSVHAMEHHFRQAGRIIQWLDLILLAPSISNLGEINYPNRVYPPLKFIKRALPYLSNKIDINCLVTRVNRHIRYWSDTVPLDRRSGLAYAKSRKSLNKTQSRWSRWKPYPWRVVIVYDEGPIAQMYLKYLRLIITRAINLIKIKLL
jgi:hypothetical protein